MSKEKKLTRGCVVFMKASSGLTGYGNEQCVSSVCEELGTVSLFGHNQHYKIYDIDRITEYPPSQAEIEELKEQLAAANHDYEELMKERIDYVAENKSLRKKRDDLLAALKNMVSKSCNCINCKQARAAIKSAGGQG